MAPPSSIKQKMRPVYKLRNRDAFDSFVETSPFAVIVVYHYLCPECETYVKQLKKLAVEYRSLKNLNFAKIHIQLQWMIDKANLSGDVSEENTFLKELDVGSKVPATMFYRNGSLIWKIEGVLEPPIFRGLIKKLCDAEN
jgi:thiol-disulfide isomerase/thioredoxin